MARRGGRSNTVAAPRDPLRSLASELSARLPTPLPDPVSVVSPGLEEVEDGRLWHPDPDRGALTVGGRYARLVVHKRPLVARANTLFSPRSYPVGFQVPVGFRFESPFKVVTCLRRKVRRQIMFAKRKAGFGKKRRMPRRTWRSDVSC